MKSLHSLRMICLSILVALAFVGCGSMEPTRVMSIRVNTPDVVLQAEDNSFKLEAGIDGLPPFRPAEYGYELKTAKMDLLSLYPIALAQMNAKRVLVTYPNLQQPLHGVLLLFQIVPGGTGPATRMYQIDIPQQYVDAATGGRVSVVYELYKVPDLPGGEAKSWILWLSDMPFK
jgi:hypothetical protein